MGMRYFSMDRRHRDDVRSWLIKNVGPKRFHFHNDWKGGEGWSIGDRTNKSNRRRFNVAVEEEIATYLILRFGS